MRERTRAIKGEPMDDGWLDDPTWEIETDPTIGREGLAAWLRLPLARLDALIGIGVIPIHCESDGEPRFHLAGAIAAYLDWIHSRTGDAPLSYSDAKTRSLAALARTRELAAEQARGTLVDVADVERTWNVIGVEYAQRWRALPSRVSRDLSLTVTETKQIQRTVDEILTDFASRRPLDAE